jgi:HAMP domain-containing protein
MTLQNRTLLMVSVLLVATVFATAAALTWLARKSLMAQASVDGIVIARLLAHSTEFVEQVPQDVETAIGEHMVVEATIVAHLVAIAEDAGLSPDEINAHLIDIAANTALDEFWITDETGHAYLRNELEIDFSFDPDPVRQPQAHAFWPLLEGAPPVVQDARQREVDTQVFKYAGVGGIDKPRIVQVGYLAGFLEQLRERIGSSRLVGGQVDAGNVSAILVVDKNQVTRVFKTAPDLDVLKSLNPRDSELIAETMAVGSPLHYWDGDLLKAAAPMFDSQGQVSGATMVYLSTKPMRLTMGYGLLLAAVAAVVVLAISLLTFVVIARRVTEPVNCLTAAAAQVEAKTFELEALADVAQRPDELGQLARVFQRMAREVQAREQRLTQEVQELRVEIDQARRARQVAEITETEYFEQLRDKAEEIRRRKGPPNEATRE